MIEETTVKSLNTSTFFTESDDVCVVFLAGGNTNLGKDRFLSWQKKFYNDGISSVSFDFSGVAKSGSLLSKSSLSSRVDESVQIADWLAERKPCKKYILYGVSMGGYIALGLVNKRPDFFHSIILQTPAAYAATANDVTFGHKFKSEIVKKDSWINSSSFGWLENYKKTVLLIEAEFDEVIPKKIIDIYRDTKKDDSDFEYKLLAGAKHDIWGSSNTERAYKDEVFKYVKELIVKK